MHIFISYAKADARDLAKQIFTQLNSLPDVSAWMDTSLVPAQSWAEQIQEELDRSDLVLVIITPDVNRARSERQATSFVLKEINYAQSLHKPVLPVMGNFTHLPVQIADLEYIDFSNDFQEGMRRLEAYIRELTGTPLQSWQVDTIDSSAGRMMEQPMPPDWTPPPAQRPAPPKRKGNPLLGLFSGVMTGCIVGGIMLAVVAWAVFTFALSGDDLSDAEATQTSEAELTATASAEATQTRTPTDEPSPTRTVFVPAPTQFVPTATQVVPTRMATGTIAASTSLPLQSVPTSIPTATIAPSFTPAP